VLSGPTQAANHGACGSAWIPRAEKLALLRYALIVPLVIESLPRGELTLRAEEIAARRCDFPESERTGASADTLLKWAVRYDDGGFEALAPKPRQDRGLSRVVTPQLPSLVERLKRENPHRTGTTLLRALALSSGEAARPVRETAARTTRIQEVRGRTEQPDLADRHTVRALGAASEGRPHAGVSARNLPASGRRREGCTDSHVH
jgi:transposase